MRIDLAGSPGSGSGKALPAAQFALQAVCKGRGIQQLCQCHKALRIRRFSPECQRIAPKGSQNMHPGSGKGFRRGTGPRVWQRHHKIGPVLQGGLCAHRRRQRSKPAALHHIAAHAHHNRLCAQRAHLCDLIGMALVKRIIFCNNSCNFHFNPRLYLAKVFSSLYNIFSKLPMWEMLLFLWHGAKMTLMHKAKRLSLKLLGG